ncbi:MAG TPA: hypothetical protein VFB03_01205 [Candidatus Saccharimonadales bacterium]|nr:hypothetical protein [Candidatus Saccharimonadales bacterium]
MTNPDAAGNAMPKLPVPKLEVKLVDTESGRESEITILPDFKDRIPGVKAGVRGPYAHYMDQGVHLLNGTAVQVFYMSAPDGTPGIGYKEIGTD